jgi:hypothetical protein
MRSEEDLIGRAEGHIAWYPAIGGQPMLGPPHHGPGPQPCGAVSGLAEAASLKLAAASLPEGDLRGQLQAVAARSIDDILDHWCGAHRPWPWPGPPPWTIVIAAQLAAVADSHQAGFLRDECCASRAGRCCSPSGGG